jgi:hypothetical protein
VPSIDWPAGYKPVMTRVCKAVGPMQLNKGNVRNFIYWPEVQKMFPERGWAAAVAAKKSPVKEDPLTLAQFTEPDTNVKMAYAVLEHWKNECRGKDGSTAPIGVWLTAYRYGRCPFKSKYTDRYHIDDEAKLRCKLAETMSQELSDDKTSGYKNPTEAACTYGSRERA